YYFFVEDYRIEAGEELPPEPDAGVDGDAWRSDSEYWRQCWWLRDGARPEDVQGVHPGTLSCPDPRRAPVTIPTTIPDAAPSNAGPAGGGAGGGPRGGGRSSGALM